VIPLSDPLGSPENQLDRALAELYALHELAKLLASSIELAEVVAYILDALCGVMSTEGSFLYSHEVESGTLKLLGTRGPTLGLPDTVALTSAHWIAQVAAARVPLTQTDDDRTLMAISLRAHDTLQGVVGIGTRTPRQFTPPEMDRLTANSHLAAMTLENARLYARIQILAITDGLTGLYNHRHFFDELHREMTRARRQDMPLSLLMLDLDHFKQFNDTFGHLRGDELLRAVARVLRENVRSMDLAARYGGEEFAMILPGVDLDQARRAAERIRQQVARMAFHGDTPVTVSIGVTSLDPARGDESPQAFARRADLALYRAKQTGRNRVCVYAHDAQDDSEGERA